jgi:hypothetical protein
VPVLAGLVLGIALVAAPAAARDDEHGAVSTGFTGIGSALCTVVYAPLKVGYAVGGSVISGLAWMWTLGDTSISGPILRSAVRGDYVVTPSHLRGQRDLEFIGPQY